MERNPTLTFMTGTPPNEYPITDLTSDKIRLVCVYGEHSGKIVYPDNVVNPLFANLGNGQYGIGYFNHENFKNEIGNGYFYYVKVQRKIGNDWTDDFKHGVFYVGDVAEVIDFLISSEATIRATADANEANARATADALLMPKTGGIFTGHIAATHLDSSGIELNVGTNNGKVWIGNSNFGTPVTTGTPIYGNSLTTKNWVNTEITNRLATLQEGNYQESINIVRVIPQGVANAGQVYLNWVGALSYGTGLVNANKQLTVLIAGMNESIGGVNLDMLEYDAVNHYYRCITDYVHVKGLHNNCKIISSGNFSYPYNHFKAGALGRVVMDNLYFYFDNDGQTGDIENIIFRNCKFESRGGNISFINCQFDGLNTFQSTTNNEFSFNNCYGLLFGKTEITSSTPYETMTTKFNPQIITKQQSFLEPVGSSSVRNGSLFCNVNNNNRLSYKNLDGNLYQLENTPEILVNTVRGDAAMNSSIFIDIDNSNQLSFKDKDGIIHSINIT